MKKVIICFAGLLVALGASAQLRPLTSTYPFNGLLLNPAFAGSLNRLSAVFAHRKQWINVDGAPTFSAFTINNSFYKNRVGIGLQATQDNIGVHEMSSVYGSYAYKIRTSFGTLSMGLQGGFDNRKSDFAKLSLKDLEDNNLPPTIVSRFTPNFGVGFLFSNKNVYAGISSPYLLENKAYVFDEGGANISDSRESRYYYATGGVVFRVSDNMQLSPSTLLRVQEQNRIAYDITGLVIFDDIAYVGLSYRNSREITFIGQLILNDNFRVGYAYDANASEISTETTGSHEILVNYRIKIHNYKKDPECPVYF